MLWCFLQLSMSTSPAMQTSPHRQPTPGLESPTSISSSSSSNTMPRGWIKKLQTHMPELDDMGKLEERLDTEGKRLFDEETHVRILRILENGEIEDNACKESMLREYLSSDAQNFQLFYITMHDKEIIDGDETREETRFRISAKMFGKLALRYELPVAFVESLLNHGKQLRHFGFGSRLHPIGSTQNLIRDFWYILPVRVPMGCSDPTEAHRGRKSGDYQMNAFNHLHLGQVQPVTDIRRFEIAVFFTYDISNKKTTVVCVNSHSRSDLKGPRRIFRMRVKAALKEGGNAMIDRNPLWINLVYIGQVVRWWQTTLEFFSDELICHEKHIEDRMRAAQRPQEAEEPPDENTALETNRALHAMAAHCLRYKTELDALSNVVLELINQHEELSAQLELGTYEKERVSRALKQQLAAVTASTRTREELAKKTKNAMALLFHSVQAEYGRLQVSNGGALQEISRASQNEVIETRKDSVAMKTIAIMTMFFLPATTISAILALPYFQLDAGEPEKTVWIWAILTAAVTIIIFTMYRFLLQPKEKEIEKRGGLNEEDIEKQ